MENASKALTIAGAVITALLVISLALVIYNNVKNSLNVAGVQIDNIIVQEYNQKYLIYDKEYVTGVEVKECISEVLYTNANATNDKVFVTGLTVVNRDEMLVYVKIEVDDKGYKTVTYNEGLSLASIPNSSRYTTKIIVGNDGLVENILFTIK